MLGDGELGGNYFQITAVKAASGSLWKRHFRSWISV